MPREENKTQNPDTDIALSLIRRRLDDAAKEIQAITSHGRSASKDPSLIPRFRAAFRLIDKYLNKLESNWDELMDLVMTQDLKDVPTDKDKCLLDHTKRYYYESCMIENALSTKPIPPSGSDSSNLLPKVPLPHFNGELSQWPKFRDTFESIVHNSTTLSSLAKFHYLTTSLSGSAAATISHLPLLDANYDIAWSALLKAYNNKRLLALSYLNAMIDGPSLTSKPDCEALDTFLAHSSENVSALKKLDIKDIGDFILFYLSFRRLDPTSREQFENQLSGEKEFPTFESLTDFLQVRSRSLHMTDPRTLGIREVRSKPPVTPHRRPTSRVTLTTESPIVPSSPIKQCSDCFVCKQSHKLIECTDFVMADPNKRRALLKGFTGCFNCLGSGHFSHSCPSKNRCRLCQRTHHTMLHLPAAQSSPGTTKVALSAMVDSAPKVLLGTAVAIFRDAQNKLIKARLLVDCGSQTSLITSRLQQKLGLPITRINQTVLGIGQVPFQGVKGKISCQLSSCNPSDLAMTCEALVVDTIISAMPNFSLSESDIEPYLTYPLADPRFWESSEIDFLLGADLFPKIISGSSIRVQETGPWLVSSTFGYLIIGNVPSEEAPSSNISLVTDADPLPQQNEDLDRVLRQFWEIEAVSSATTNPLDDTLEHHFSSTHSRAADGRYIVCLPWREVPPTFENCFPMAWRRLLCLESKLAHNHILREKYVGFMREYSDLGHMVPTSSPSAYLLPHHGVLKGEKIRVVFDASAKTADKSLNCHLHIGPKLQNDIRDLLMDFRRHKVVLVADIVKMYRQILIHPGNRCYQHILWRETPSQPVQTYELTTLTYGMSCAPYLAQRVLQQLIQDEGHDFPLASLAVKNNMYMDDIVTGCDSMDEAIDLQQQLVAMMARGGFQLDKWTSNHPELIAPALNQERRALRTFHEPPDSLHKILGLQWDSVTDSLRYEIDVPTISETKRGMLSFIARIYDPIGLLAPVTLTAKAMIQELWKAGLNWDDEATPDIRSRFRLFASELPLLSSLVIPRQVLPKNVQAYQIVGFADASQIAYCAALFLRAQGLNGEVKVSLITAKTRLAPLKIISIPRLELCAAQLLAQTYLSIQVSLNKLPGSKTSPVFFSDSRIVLHWLRTPAYRLKTFVANRVTDILTITSPEEWRHVKGSENPSDLGSRGLFPSGVIDNTLWWQGPDWLAKTPSFWPSNLPATPHDLPELKDDSSTSPCILHVSTASTDWMEHFSKLNRLIRVTAWIRRFVNNCSPEKDTLTGPMTLPELNDAKTTCIRALQSYHFFGGLKASSENIPSSFNQLRAFVDHNGVLRVGGRLSNSDIHEDSRHPILLPKRSHFTNLIVDHYHHFNLHPGPGLLQALIQQRFWVPGLRTLARKRAFRCVRCYRLGAARKDVSPVMGDLPAARVNVTRAFLSCGVDFAGPLLMRTSRLRKAAQTRVYICLFVCMATKALHLEPVTDLSSEAFLACLNRFISRRGCPNHMYSDCGTNFQGSARQLREWYTWYSDHTTQENIVNFTNIKEITWHFNPPHSPHFGGLWEAGVKSVKAVLRKVVGGQALTFEEWATILCKIEALLNSRPLCPLSPSPDEINFLTPAHFLIGGSLTSPPEPNLVYEPLNTLTRWQLLNRMTQHFWKRWSIEYLSNLQTRTKWTKDRPNHSVGDLVLLKDKAPPLHWPLARIVSVHPGKDGVVRVATIKIGSSNYVRPVHKLVPFPPKTN